MYSDINEEDIPLMQSLSRILSENAPTAFPEIESAKFHASSVDDLRTIDVAIFLSLLDANLGQYYTEIHGRDWKVEKQEEMLESGLVYVWYTSAAGLLGFVSFKLCNSDGAKVLYLYEIHVSPRSQGQNYGTKLIDGLHRFVTVLREHENPYLNDIKGTGLTVFAQNTRAYDWYIKLGYEFTSDSPRDKQMRSGKVIKPDFYLLKRLIS